MTDLITRLEEAADMKCPKCNARSGDDWEQCKGSCPMPGSPYFESQPQGQAMTDTVSETEISFEVWQDGDMVAAADSLSDAQHFMVVYGQDGPVEAKTAITTRFPGFNVVTAMLAASPQGEGSSADADTHRASEGAVLATVIRENLLGVSPDDQAVVLEDDDWRLILASLERFGASDRPRR